nr:unnamed protein product [Spirometra erinaceieuropaei]
MPREFALRRRPFDMQILVSNRSGPGEVVAHRGRIFVDIREYYEDKSDGGLKPGKKGISLNVEQWDKLREVMDVLNADIKKM